MAFDSLKNPYPGGLYDKRMGVSPHDKLNICQTCGQAEQECAGHFGHIALHLPVMNLFLIKDITKIL